MSVTFTNIDHGETQSLRCLSGVFFMRPSQLIGATTGVLFTHGAAVPVRQVPGPNLRGPSLASVNGRFVTLCGSFIPDTNGLIFNVQVVIVRGGTGPGTSGTILGSNGNLV